MTCSLALDHGVHSPPLCAANKAKTDVATSVRFGVGVCVTDQVTAHIPRTFTSDTRRIIWKDAAFVCKVGREGRDGGCRAGCGGGGPLPGTFSQIPLLVCSLPWFSATLCLPVSSSFTVKWKHSNKSKPFCPSGWGRCTDWLLQESLGQRWILQKVSFVLLLLYCLKKGNDWYPEMGTDCWSYLGWSL